MRYSVTAHAVATAAVVDTWKTLIGIIMADTLGFRARVRAISIGPGGEAAQDVNVTFRLGKTNNATAGTATAATPKAFDPLARASIATAGVNYSAEPTTLDSQFLWQAGLNGRGSLLKEWDAEGAPIVNRKETLVLQATPGAANAVKFDVTVEYEEF